jgi:hypothetical protein
MAPQVSGNEGVEKGAVICVESAASDQVFGNWLRLIPRPRLKRGDKLALIDQTVLEREQAE